MIYFATDKRIPNYLHDTRPYKYPTDNSFYGIGLSCLETCYPYHILRNKDCDIHIELITYEELYRVGKSDTLIFYMNTHYTDVNIVNNLNCRLVQIVTDTPIIDGVDMYITYDPSVVAADSKRNWKHVLYPLPIGLVKCKPSWPPTNITCVSPNMYTTSKLTYDNDLTFVTDSYHNTGDEHILFHIRDNIVKHDNLPVSQRMKFPSHKTANRLYQSWYAGVPGIFTSNPAMEHIRDHPYDYLIANDLQELRHNINRLRTDEGLYSHMVNICRSRSEENNHDVIYKQWMSVLTELT